MSIKQIRKEKGLTQEQCANYLNIPLRSYKRYEVNEDTVNPIKHQYIINKLSQYGFIDEEHGLLTLDEIKKTCVDVFSQYPIEYCYLFGSYAKGNAQESSDVDLLISMPVNGLMFYELIELLREKLRKKVDLLDVAQLTENPNLTKEILRDGIKIYG